MTDRKHIVYVYGTLRPGGHEHHMIPGVMYRVGWFPGIKIDMDASTWVVAERVEVDDAGLARLDAYEGYDPKMPKLSLFKRVRYADGWIYEYNDNTIDRDIVDCGDWLKFRKQERGPMADMVKLAPAGVNHHDFSDDHPDFVCVDYCSGPPAAKAVGIDSETEEKAA